MARVSLFKVSALVALLATASLSLAQTVNGPPPVPAPVPIPDTKGSVVEPPFMESFPALKSYLYSEPASGFYLGFGLSPIGVMKDRTVFTANFFQLHYIGDRWDYTMLSTSYGVTRAQSTIYQSNNFVFSTSLKVKVGNTFSFGPLVGYEFVNFPNLSATLLKAPYQTPPESFSSKGLIYGGMVTETFHYKDYLIQVNEIGYQQTYSNDKTEEGWKYIYDSPDVRQNPSLIAASFVMMIELSFLF